MSEQGNIPAAELRRLRRAATADTQAREKADVARDDLITAVKAAKAAGGSVRTIAAEIGRAPKTIQTYLHTNQNTP
ncbi:Uncharacterised protein [Mycobacteroides abscessus subsp. massiliense]|uniref:hypothetical protein n=1 Tax=Mycobacteroides abscessus TaxID=36809 RepID=UPI0009A6594D|nr:hypothetical protein [Mycobacteroides abscessus]SKF35929.1 Uncharacterised protein [Mycobacteroides abscessus subsp. massiliense]SKF43602.1 Uncharacterised protein [Mycobacteroides abscessus subsp. massiliense]SKF45431.1 Uncharacterised protein [Mycobacteroides abscessus subsp. massiliense]SKF48263.1 Uncharacterised protein [Mycobacteroides abscessus subsp. massiliense]SKF50122.1 Uncharacterised protein [Mycobacteroides abscessus subsp. massiliense]